MKIPDLIPFLSLPGLHQSGMKEDLRQLPPLFLQHLLPGMRMRKPKEIRELLSVFHALKLDTSDSLLAAVSRLVCGEENSLVLAWCKVVAQQPQDRRAAFVAHTIENRCHTNTTTSALINGLKEFNHLMIDDNYDKWMSRFLIGWRRGISMEYLVAGIRLASQFYPSYQFHKIRQCTDFPSKLVEDLACYFPGEDVHSHGYRILRLWERSAKVSQFTNVLRTTKWFDLSPESSYRYAAMILDFCWHHENSRQFRQKWNIFKEELPRIERLVQAVPKEFQERAIDEINGIAMQMRRRLDFAPGSNEPIR